MSLKRKGWRAIYIYMWFDLIWPPSLIITLSNPKYHTILAKPRPGWWQRKSGIGWSGRFGGAFIDLHTGKPGEWLWVALGTTVSASSQLERVVEQLRGLKVCQNSSPTPSSVPEDTLKSCGKTVSSIGGKHGGHESPQPLVDLTVSDDETCTSSSTSRVDRVAEILKRARENKQKPKTWSPFRAE